MGAVGGAAVSALSRRRPRAGGESGQSIVEFVALLPLFVAVAVAILQTLAAGAAEQYAGHAAQSAAVAVAQGRDGAAAARAALPGWARSRVDVRVVKTRVTVRVTPPSLLPGLGARLRATATADAGPAS
jgi:pilus assembly protein CpaE